MSLYASGGPDRRLHVAWGAVGPFGRRSFLTLEPSGECRVQVRDLQEPAQRADYRMDFSRDVVAAVWKAIADADFKDRAVVDDEVQNGDFIEVSVEEAGQTTVTLLRNGYHRPTLVFIQTLNGYLPGEVQVGYSLLNPEALAVRAAQPR